MGQIMGNKPSLKGSQINMAVPRQATAGTLQQSCNMGPMDHVKKTLSGQILGNSLLNGQKIGASVKNGQARDSPPQNEEDEADAGDLENPTIPLHHWRYELTVPRRKSV